MCDSSSINESHELNFFWLLIVQTIVYTFDVVGLISTIHLPGAFFDPPQIEGVGEMTVASFSQTLAGYLACLCRSQLFRFSGSGQLEFDLSLAVKPIYSLE